MENFHEFNERISTFQNDSVPYEPEFGLPPSLEEKVTPQIGTLKPFYGDTVAYFLNSEQCALIEKVSNKLHSLFSNSLSQPIPATTAHVTLHDLHSAPEREKVRTQIEQKLPRTIELVAKARNIGPVHMRCTTVFNLMNTSVVVGLTPIDEEEHSKLLTARELFDEIVPSGLYTPHITLAYYRPAMPELLHPDNFRHALIELTRDVTNIPITLFPEHLHVTHFDSMSTYWTLR